MEIIIIILTILAMLFFTTIISLKQELFKSVAEIYRLKKENADYALYNEELYEIITNLKKEIESK